MILGANQFGFPAVGKFLAGNLKLGSINQKIIQIKSLYNACYAAVGGGLVGWMGWFATVRHVYVCCFVLSNRYCEIVTVLGFPHERAKGACNYDWESLMYLLTLSSFRQPEGGRILFLHLNCVTRYTGPPVFLSERTSPNGPKTTPLTTRGSYSGASVVWASSRFVRPHWWGSFRSYCKISWVLGSQRCEILNLPRKRKTNFFVLKQKKKQKTWRRKDRDPPQRGQGLNGSFSHLRTVQSDNEPLDPATLQNYMGVSGRDVDEFRHIWEFCVSEWGTAFRRVFVTPPETMFVMSGLLVEPGPVTWTR